ncbi:MAG: hypothetical protein IH609_01585 [Dehalococcoidia bacterium]|nr:hypothetical protein [Dehalococcoidia bacterium]
MADDREHGHDHDGHGHEHGHEGEPPHAPAPPEPRRLVPERPMLVRGLGMATLACGLLWAGWNAAGRTWLLAPAGLALAGGGLLSAWAAVIHLTGGERFDDHPFV